jgi:hypothetical protein
LDFSAKQIEEEITQRTGQWRVSKIMKAMHLESCESYASKEGPALNSMDP